MDVQGTTWDGVRSASRFRCVNGGLTCVAGKGTTSERGTSEPVRETQASSPRPVGKEVKIRDGDGSRDGPEGEEALRCTRASNSSQSVAYFGMPEYDSLRISPSPQRPSQLQPDAP